MKRPALAVVVATLVACTPDHVAPTAPLSRPAPSAPGRASVSTQNGVTTISDDFSSGTFDPAAWATRTDIPPGNAAASVVNGAAQLQNRAFLNTVRGFDPTAPGGLHVTGEWTVAGAGDDFMQIETRSDGIPAGQYGEDDAGVEALAFTQNVGESPNLMTVVGRSASVTVTSAPGQLTIAAGVTYLFDITDDGTTVTFTLTNKNDPTQTRTITATSSYVSAVGKVTFHNRENCCSGTHIARIDNVSITGTALVDKGPVANAGGPYTANENTPLTLSGAGSTDADGDALTYAWDLDGDGTFETAGVSATVTYPSASTHTVTLQVTDAAGVANTATATIDVVNVVPKVSVVTGAQIQPGGTFSTTGSFVDPGLETWTGTVDYGDGSGAQALTLAADKTFSLSHVYPTAGQYTVTVSVSDGQSTGTTTTPVIVGNVAPVARISGIPSFVLEGNRVTFSATNSTDANGDPLTYQWDTNGDGVYDQTGSTVTVTFPDEGTVPITLKATDPGGLSGTATVNIVVRERSIALGLPFGVSMTQGPTGATYAASENFNDVSGDTWTVMVDYGDGTGAQSTPFTVNSTNPALKVIALHHVYSVKAGTYTAKVTVTDDEGTTTSRGFNVAVPNMAPIARAGTYTGVEGTAVALDAGASSDPNNDPLTYAWDLDGDGTYETAGQTATVTFPTPGSYTVGLRVADPAGLASTTTTTITVVNAPPVVAKLADTTILASETYAASGSFTDPGSDVWTATVDYGDGSGAQPLTLTGKTFALGHTYTNAGAFTVTVTVSDNFGGSGSSTATVLVQSPAQASAALGNSITQLVSSGALNQGDGTALTSTLAAASQQLANGNTNAGVNQLNAFINKVSAMSGKKLTTAQASQLIAAANRIIAAAGK